MSVEFNGYNSNPNLKPAFYQMEYTQDQIMEIVKCESDFFYFCRNYCKILSNSKFVLFDPRPYQVEMAQDILDNKYVLGKWPRQSGKSTILAAIIAWFTIFRENHTSLIAAHVHSTAIEIMSRVKDIIEHLPWWLQSGVVKWNTLSVEFENGSRVISSATTEKTGRGFSLNFCVGGETEILIRNKDTGICEPTKIKELTNMGEKWSTDLFDENYISFTDILEIMTPYGWCDFDGVSVKETEAYEIITSENNTLTCSIDHLLKTSEGTFETIFDIRMNDLTLESGERIAHIEPIGKTLLYDPINVDNEENSYCSDKFVSHNCLLDEFAFVNPNVAEAFYTSIEPTLSSVEDSKMVIISCVVKDTHVFTKQGIQTVENFIDSNMTPNENFGYITEEYNVLGKKGLNIGKIMVNSGMSETYKINTPYSILECSPDHKLWVCTKDGEYIWKKAKKLTTDDFVSIRYGFNLWGEENFSNIIQQWKSSKEHNFFDLDKVSENDLAYFLGLYLAGGYARDFVNKSKTVIGGQVVISCGDDLSQFFDRLNVSWKKVGDYAYLINSKSLVSFIKNCGFDITRKAKDKIIPQKMLKMNRNIISNFLSGYFDGDGTSQFNRISCVSASKPLINQIRMCLLNFGILSTYTTGTTPSTKRVKVSSVYHRLEMSCSNGVVFLDNIGFRLIRKRENFSFVNGREGSNKIIIPYAKEIMQKYDIDFMSEDIRPPHMSKTKCLRIINSESNKNKIPDNILEEVFSDDIVWVKPVSIEKSRNEVYDFSLDDIADDFWCHSVLYNGIVGHQTPNGMNHFYKMVVDAQNKKSSFQYNEITWDQIPGRDETFREKTIATVGETRWAQEYEASFLGNEHTLIRPQKLAQIPFFDPTDIHLGGALKIFEKAQEKHNYFISVDTSRGVGIDSNALVVFDITEYPVKIVAHFADPHTSPILYPSIINQIARSYNNATVMVETNDNGQQVVDILHDEYDYDNLVGAMVKGRAGQQLTIYSEKSKGLRTTAVTKRVGCSNLKNMIEFGKIIINSFDIIKELSTFVLSGSSYEADTGMHDDLVMCLVNFAWAASQTYFKNYIEMGIKDIYMDALDGIEDIDLPMGVFDDGDDSPSSYSPGGWLRQF